MEIVELPLSVKTIHALEGKYKSVRGSYALVAPEEERTVPEIKIVKELVGCTETDLLRRPGLGRKRLAEIKDWLNKRGLSLKDEQTRKKSLTPEQTETLKNIFDKTKSFCDSGLTEAMFYHLYPRAIRDTLNVLGYEWPEWLWPIAERYED